MKYLAALRPKDQLVPIANTMIQQEQGIFYILAIIRPIRRFVHRNCIHIIQHPAEGCPRLSTVPRFEPMTSAPGCAKLILNLVSKALSFKKETGDFHLSTCLSHISLINYLVTIVTLKAPVKAKAQLKSEELNFKCWHHFHSKTATEATVAFKVTW